MAQEVTEDLAILMDGVYEQVAVQGPYDQGKKLSFRLFRIGRWWSNNRAKHK